jgi:predicted DNA-binding protein (UPF0251 family)
MESATSPAAIEQLLRKLANTPAPKKPEKPAEEKPAKLDTEAPEKPEGEATPPPEEKPEGEPPAEPAADKPEGEEKPEGEGDDDGEDSLVTPIKGNKARLSFTDEDKVGKLAAVYKHRNRDWTLEQAMEAAKKQLGVGQPPTTEKSAAETPAKPSDGLPETVEEIDAATTKLEAERLKAFTDLKFEDAAKMDITLRKLDVKRQRIERETERAVERQQQEQQTAYTTQFSESEKKAISLFPDAAKPDSAFGKRMVELEKVYEDTNDPIFTDPNKPLIIAQTVARELRIAPNTKTTPVTRPAKAPEPGKPGESKPKSILPSGSGKTAPPQSPNGEFATKVTKVQSLSELRKLAEASGIKMEGL